MDRTFARRALQIGLPVAVQTIFQYLLGVLDSLMVGELGSTGLSGVGSGVKAVQLYAILISSVGASAGIFFVQYYSSQDKEGLSRTAKSHLMLMGLPFLLFFSACFFAPGFLAGLFSKDAGVQAVAGEYMRISSLGFLPLALSHLLSAYFRSASKAHIPMITGIASLAFNAAFDFLFVTGRFSLPALGTASASISNALSQTLEAVALLLLYRKWAKKEPLIRLSGKIPPGFFKKIFQIALPVFLGEVVWGLGETVYGLIYGNMGKEPMAAVTAASPLMSLLFGAFTGFSTAAAVLTGEKLAASDFQEAYHRGQRLLKAALWTSAAVGLATAAFSSFYMDFYNLSESTRLAGTQLLYAFSLLLPVKTVNLVVMCGILPSGGKTEYGLYLNALGTWGVGVPLGALSAFLFRLPVPLVFLLINLEECLRAALGLGLVKKRKWMRNIT